MPFHNLSTVFSYGNLTQASTIKSFIGFAVSIGLLHLTPSEQEQVASLALRLIADVTETLSAAHAAYALVNLLYNERRHANLPPQP